MGNNKSLGPNGYTPFFFNKAWDVVGIPLFHAVSNFFDSGYMPGGVNSTFITLVPKCD